MHSLRNLCDVFIWPNAVDLGRFWQTHNLPTNAMNKKQDRKTKEKLVNYYNFEFIGSSCDIDIEILPG